MSKPITVSSIAYVHTDDVDPEKHLSAIRTSEAMNVAVVRAVRALESETGTYNEFQRANMQTCPPVGAVHARIHPKGSKVG